MRSSGDDRIPGLLAPLPDQTLPTFEPNPHRRRATDPPRAGQALSDADVGQALWQSGILEATWGEATPIATLLASTVVPAMADVACFDARQGSHGLRRIFSQDAEAGRKHPDELFPVTVDDGYSPLFRACLEGRAVVHQVGTRAPRGHDAALLERVAAEANLRSVLMVPVVRQGSVDAVLTLAIRHPDRATFSAADIPAARRAASFLLLAVERASARDAAGTTAPANGGRDVPTPLSAGLPGPFGAALRHDVRNALMPVYLRLDVLALRLRMLAAEPRAAALENDLRNLRASAEGIARVANGIRMLVADPFDAAELRATVTFRDWWLDASPVLADALPGSARLQARHSVDVRLASPVALTHLLLAALTAWQVPPGAGVRAWCSPASAHHPPRLILAVRPAVRAAPVGTPAAERAAPPDDRTDLWGPDVPTVAALRDFAARFGARLQVRADRRRIAFLVELPQPDADLRVATRQRSARVQVADARIRALTITLLKQGGFAIREGSEAAVGRVDVEIVDRAAFVGVPADAATPDGRTLRILIDDSGGHREPSPAALRRVPLSELPRMLRGL